MTLHALIRDGQIVQAGPLPRTYWDGARWWDYRHDPDPAPQGWHPVAATPRPDDTTTAWDSSTTLQTSRGGPPETAHQASPDNHQTGWSRYPTA